MTDRGILDQRRPLQMLLRVVGKTYDPDPELPPALVRTVLMTKAIELLRGLIRARARVFLGPGVRMRGRSRMRFGKSAAIGRGTVIDGFGRKGVVLGERSRLGAYCVVTTTSHLSRFGEGFSLGADSGLGDFCHIGASGGVVIGRDVIAGSYVSFHSQEHRFDDVNVPIRLQGTTEHGISIGDNCWIGARVTILDGTEIGAGSVIAAGAVVKGNFPPRAVIAGVPARVVRRVEGPDA